MRSANASDFSWPNFGFFFRDVVARYADRVALRHRCRGATAFDEWSYARIGAEGSALASCLLSRGLERGDRVIIWSENRPEWGVAYFALVAAGLVAVPIDVLLPVEDVARIVKAAEPSAVVASRSMAERLGEAGPRAFGSIMSLNATIVIVLSIPIARLMRSRPPLWCMAMAAGAFVLGFSMLALPFGIAWIAASTLVWTVGEIIQSVNVGVFVPSRSPANWRASFQSFSASCTQAGHSLGPLAAGPVIAALGSGGLWALAAAACALWGLGAMALNRREARDRD